MAVTDPIADYLTRLRNAQLARHAVVEIPGSKLKERITEILYAQGFIHKYKIEQAEGFTHSIIKIAIKYDSSTKKPVIRKMVRVSRPGLRKYVKATEVPRIINGLGTAIVSTSKGVITGKQARDLGVGGEVLCYIY
jgi:small subunit ribosomal protein S8